MTAYVVKRVATSMALIVLSSMLIFIVMRLIPGDPTLTKLGADMTDVDPRALQAIRHQLGLDQSIPYQYVHWIAGIFHGSFGRSYYSDFPVTKLITQRFGATFELAVVAILLGLLMSLPVALIGAIWRSRAFDSLVSGFTAVGMATPAFVSGILLIVVFGVELKLLPTQGYVSFAAHPVESLKVVLLPAVALGIAIAAPLLRILRASLTDIESAPYVRTAAGKGLLRREVVVRHILPNAGIPALTTFGVIVASLLGGTVIVEYAFARPGLGSLMVDAIYQRDYAVLQALVLLAAVTFILTSLVIDLAYGVIDPRLRVRVRRVAT